LLGCIKGGSILPGDRDVDLGMWAVEREKLNIMLPFLKSEGFSVKQRYDPAHECIKGMITIKRGIAPIDIKLYSPIDSYMVRGIHKSSDFKSKAIWELIDILYFKSSYSRVFPGGRREIPFHYFLILLSKFSFLVTNKKSEALIKILSELWRKSATQYGMEILPIRYARELEVTRFYGLNVNRFKYFHEYLDEEYGAGWDRDNPHGKGGVEKYSHILLNEKTSNDVRRDKELFNRCMAVGYLDLEVDEVEK